MTIIEKGRFAGGYSFFEKIGRRRCENMRSDFTPPVRLDPYGVGYCFTLQLFPFSTSHCCAIKTKFYKRPHFTLAKFHKYLNLCNAVPFLDLKWNDGSYVKSIGGYFA